MRAKHSGGFALIDIALTVGLVAIGVVLALGVYTQGRRDVITLTAADEILTLQQRVQDYYVAKDGYDNPALDDARALNRNLVPDLMLRGSPASARTRWFATVNVVSLSDRLFRVSTSVPQLECADFVSRLIPHFREVRLNAGGGAVVVGQDGAPVPGDLARMCSSARTLAVELDSA